jgi:hypothetical protein
MGDFKVATGGIKPLVTPANAGVVSSCKQELLAYIT